MATVRGLGIQGVAGIFAVGPRNEQDYVVDYMLVSFSSGYVGGGQCNHKLGMHGYHDSA